MGEKLGGGAITPDTIYVKGGDANDEDATFLITNGNVIASSSTDPFTAIQPALTAEADATLRFNGTGDTFDPGDLSLYGGNPAAGGDKGGVALFDYDVGTLTDPDTLNMYGHSTIDSEQSFNVAGNLTVAINSGDTFATQAQIDMLTSMTLDVNGTLSINAASGSAVSVQLEKVGNGNLTVDHATIASGSSASRHPTLLISDGNFSVVAASAPTTTVEAADSADADATLHLNASGHTHDVATLNLKGGNPAGGAGGIATFDFDLGALTVRTRSTCTVSRKSSATSRLR